MTITERPTLREPVLVVMLSGWIDASGAAAAAMSVLESECSARTIATFDRDTFIDYRARRPVMEIREGRNSRLVWPDIELKVGRDRSGRDVLLLTGHEPDMAWSRFAQSAADLAVEFGVVKAIGIGAYPLAVPRTAHPPIVVHRSRWRCGRPPPVHQELRRRTRRNGSRTRANVL